MAVIIVSAFSNINVGSDSRARAIFDHVQGEKTVLTTDFNHGNKNYYGENEQSHPNQIRLHVPRYKKNLGLLRIWSHLVFARKVQIFLKLLDEKPDAIYCSMPTSSSAFVCARYCKKNGVKFVIDIIDLWPDSLLPLVRGKEIIKTLLFPWNLLTRYSYRRADVIMGESVLYANEGKKYNKNARVYPVYLGVDVAFIDKVKENHCVRLVKPKGEIWIAYAGSLGNSYDFKTLLDAIKDIDGRYKYKLWFIGDGVKHEEIYSYVKDNGLNVEITGFLTHAQLLGYLSYCDMAVNIFRDRTKVVYSYKFNDYVAMNCFVLNSLEGETAEMVDKYRIGRNFNLTDRPLSEVLFDTLENWGEYSSWRENAQTLIEEKLDKDKIYSVVCDIFKM